MNQKTAIQEVLEIIQLAREGEIDKDLRSIRHRVEQLLEKEKQQITDAFKEGHNDSTRAHQKYKFFDDYYSQTFNQ